MVVLLIIFHKWNIAAIVLLCLRVICNTICRWLIFSSEKMSHHHHEILRRAPWIPSSTSTFPMRHHNRAISTWRTSLVCWTSAPRNRNPCFRCRPSTSPQEVPAHWTRMAGVASTSLLVRCLFIAQRIRFSFVLYIITCCSNTLILYWVVNIL